MSNEIYDFGEDGSRRVVNVVRRVEGQSTQLPSDVPPPPPPRNRWHVKIIGPRGFGKYDLQLLKLPTADIDPDAPLTAAELGALHEAKGGVTYLGVCLDEADQETNSLIIGGIYPADMIRRQNNRQIVFSIQRGGGIESGQHQGQVIGMVSDHVVGAMTQSLVPLLGGATY